MAVETAADLAGFFEIDDHAETVSYTPAGGSAVAVSAIVNRPQSDQFLGEIEVSIPAVRLRINKADLAAAASGDAVSIASVAHVVDSAELDVSGLVWTVGAYPS